MATYKGRIVEWSGAYGRIQREGTGERDFLHQSQAKAIPKHLLKVGTDVEYEIGSYQGRPQAEKARLLGSYTKVPPKGYRFLNPYNFVRPLPPRPASNEIKLQLLGRTTPPPHDRWVGLSGQIKCSLETITPLFVSDSEETKVLKQIGKKKQHLGYRFFRLGEQKAIPATSLRGVIRSAFEAATNSGFSNFGGEQLSYRLDSREIQKLVPARVLKMSKEEPDDKGRLRERIEWRLQLLPGKRVPGQPPFDPDLGQKKGLYAAAVRFYTAIKPSGKRRSDQPEPIDSPDKWMHKQECYAVLLQMQFPPSWRVVALAKDRQEAEKLLQQKRGQFRAGSDLIVMQGWLCKTLQNADNKNSERFFFRDPSRDDVPETISLPDRIRQNYEALIRDYRRRHAADLEKRSAPDRVEVGADGKKEIAYSRFILKENKPEEKLDNGDLVYVYLGHTASGQLTPRFMVPVSWPRVAYEKAIADLLPSHLHRCDDYDALCPACRLFGWVHQKKSDHSTSAGKQVAYAGRVRFSHARLELPGKPMPEQTLAILGSPKPTTTRFYLAGPDGKPSKQPRPDGQVGYDGNNGRNQLRGRKFFRHFVPNDDFRLSNDQSDQNRTVCDAEGPGAVFKFTVDFENLAPAELGALLWTLTLGGNAYHRLGYAKPLGMGSVEVRADKIVLFDMVARYGTLEGENGQREWSEAEQREVIKQFQEVMVRPYASDELIAYAEERGTEGWRAIFEQLPNIQDMLTLLGKEPPKLPVHYPFAPDPMTQGQFEWFVGNNRLNGPRVELALATEDKGLPLIKRDGTIW